MDYDPNILAALARQFAAQQQPMPIPLRGVDDRFDGPLGRAPAPPRPMRPDYSPMAAFSDVNTRPPGPMDNKLASPDADQRIAEMWGANTPLLPGRLDPSTVFNPQAGGGRMVPPVRTPEMLRQPPSLAALDGQAGAFTTGPKTSAPGGALQLAGLPPVSAQPPEEGGDLPMPDGPAPTPRQPLPMPRPPGVPQAAAPRPAPPAGIPQMPGAGIPGSGRNPIMAGSRILPFTPEQAAAARSIGAPMGNMPGDPVGAPAPPGPRPAGLGPREPFTPTLPETFGGAPGGVPGPGGDPIAATSRGGGLRNFLGDLFMGLGSGRDMNESFVNAGRSIAAGAERRRVEGQQQAYLNHTFRWLTSKGMDANTAAIVARSPDMMKDVLKEHAGFGEPPKDIEIYDDQGRPQRALLFRDGTVKPIGGAKSNIMSPEEEAQKIRVGQATRAQTNVNVDTRAEGAFAKKGGELMAQRFDDIVQRGGRAKDMLGNISALRDIGSQIETGKIAEWQAALGPYADALGVTIDGLGPMQAYRSVVAKMIPDMRVPGSGTTSDYDARKFAESLPSLGNTPEGNALIQDTFEAFADAQIRAADIASRALSGEIDPREAERMIRELPDPLAAWKEATKAGRFGEQKTQAPQGAESVVPPDMQGKSLQEQLNAAPDGSIATFGGQRRIKRNGQWVPADGQ
jgi:hypothetical protein